MTSEGLGEMFEGDSADTCAGKFPLVLMGSEWRVQRAQTRERGPPSALARILLIAPMGVLAPGSAYTRPSAQPPIDMSGNFPAHVSAESPSKFSEKT